MSASILISMAHPDDELGCGPLVSRAVAGGAQATLICATNGDVGTVEPQYLRDYASIAELRLAELACATKAIGFTEVVTFGYRDSGMMGTADNDNPDCLWHAPLEEVTGRVIEVMRRVRPQVVITFNTYGAYGHPDHIKMNQATLAAFQQLQSEPEHPQKLYYTSGPRRLMRLGVTMMRIRGQNPRKAGINKDVDMIAAIEAITAVTTKASVAGYVGPTVKAMRCHASQISLPKIVDFLSPLAGRVFMRTTSLSRVYPEPKPGERIERDVFQGL